MALAMYEGRAHRLGSLDRVEGLIGACAVALPTDGLASAADLARKLGQLSAHIRQSLRSVDSVSQSVGCFGSMVHRQAMRENLQMHTHVHDHTGGKACTAP